MPLAWMVDCKTCQQRFAVKRRERVDGKSTEALPQGVPSRSFECPHCHDVHEYAAGDYIPGEGRIHT
jgi:hypothetical protein